MSEILREAEELLSKQYKGGQSATAYLNFCRKQYEECRDILPAVLAEARRLHGIIDIVAKNFLQLEQGIPFEGGIDGAMQSAVQEIIKLRGEIARWKALAVEERARAIYNKAMAEKKYDLAYGIHEFDEQAARELSAETEIENHIVGADQTVKLSPKAREFLKNYLRDALAGIPHIALTPERREAIKLAMTEVEYEVVTGNFKEEFSEKAEAAVGILRSMLEEAGE